MSKSKNKVINPLPKNDYQHLVNSAISELFRDALKITISHPGQALFMLKSLRNQYKAARIRQKCEKQGIPVPPFAIVSVTHHCNLRCKGCYAQSFHPTETSQAEMDTAKLSETFKQARELGIGIILIAGGEPLVRQDILEVITGFPEIIFPLFTNGLLLNEEKIQLIKKKRNVIPVVSVEGDLVATDERRGLGVFENVMKVFHAMNAQGLFFGVSITLTRNNFQTVTGETFIKLLLALGCKLFFFVEYIPVQQGTENLVLTESQRSEVLGLMASFRSKFSALFIAFPGDEERFGGCLAAGRGFIHINAQGGLEPCPFAPFSDVNLNQLSLKDALQSKLLKTIRDNPEQLKETAGGCALWEKQDWVRSLVAEKGGETNNKSFIAGATLNEKTITSTE
jgi:MoaA/NifB/PqqE/SkfB family radical SAM enzyme